MTNINNYQVYMVRCSDGSLYTGITVDLARRIQQHNGEQSGGAKYTRTRQPVVLVYQQSFSSRSLAQKEEAHIKSLSRAQKENLL